MSGSTPRAQALLDLAQMLKERKITKDEMMVEIQRLAQKSKADRVASSEATHVPTAARVDDGRRRPADTEQQERKRAIVAKLREDRQADGGGGGGGGHDVTDYVDAVHHGRHEAATHDPNHAHAPHSDFGHTDTHNYDGSHDVTNYVEGIHHGHHHAREHDPNHAHSPHHDYGNTDTHNYDGSHDVTDYVEGIHHGHHHAREHDPSHAHSMHHDYGNTDTHNYDGTHDVTAYVESIHHGRHHAREHDPSHSHSMHRDFGRTTTHNYSGTHEIAAYLDQIHHRPQAQQHYRGHGLAEAMGSGGGETDLRANAASKRERVEYEMAQKRGAELTFRPQINKVSRYSAAGDFLERGSRWQEEREEHHKKLRAEREAAAAAHSFQPRINPNTERLVARRKGTGGPDGPERLYALQAEAEQRRRKRADEEAAREMEDCTFQPTINSRSKAANVEPRYNTQPDRRAREKARKERKRQEEAFAFQPRVNAVRSDFGSAALYLEQDPFERLSRVRSLTANKENTARLRVLGGPNVSGGEFGPETFDAPPGLTGSFYVEGSSTMQPHAEERSVTGRRRRPRSASSGRRSQSAANRSTNRNTMRETPRKKNFDQFWERQVETVKRKKTSISKALQDEGNSYRPKINERSKAMVRRRSAKPSRESFLERVESSTMRHQHAKRPASVRNDVNDKCTFQPQITSRSRRRKRRSYREMSMGDQERREKAREAAKVKVIQEELSDVTFRPRLNANVHVEGQLKVASSPETYVKRQKEREKAKQQRNKQMKEMLEARRAEREGEECTFEPEIHDAPEFVKRIAKSRRLARSFVAASDAGEDGPPPFRF